MLKNNFLKFGITLCVICLFASGLLTTVYSFTKDQISAQKEKEKRNSLKEVLPIASKFEFIDRQNKSYYIGKDADDKVVGYAFLAQKYGYSSNLITMVGVDRQGVVAGIKILSQNETPGLGTKIVEIKDDKTIWSVISDKDGKEKTVLPKPWFQVQFEGKDVKTLESIETITGATISSKAVVDSIKDRAAIILEEIEGVR